jgi:hypothetical protein
MAGRTRAFNWAALVGALAVLAAPAHASFPYPPRLAPGQVPNDLTGGTAWKFSATPEPPSLLNATVRSSAMELHGVRGAHVVDPDPSAATAWTVTTGRPDVAIAVLDSGIEWNNVDAMKDLVRKVRLNKGELPKPRPCAKHARPRYDANGDGVFNTVDYACDPRVTLDWPGRNGPKGMLTPQDVIHAFSDHRDEDHNGYVDDIAGWDFLDNDNDPYDDVQYGHGTGEARDSTAEADNGNDLGTCPNCMVVPLRVGDSFVAEAARFGAAVAYAVDNRVSVVQEALGTLDAPSLARHAVDYAFRHGVTVIASAADEAAQHHNYPSSLPHVIVVNSVRNFDSLYDPIPRSYVVFNGCTNFSSKIAVSIPSTSCSSEATGRGAGIAGLIYSAALTAHDQGRLARSGDCRLVSGRRCVITPDEVRQLMASGTVKGVAQADDVNFAGPNEPSCTPPTLGCTDPMGALETQVALARPVVSPLATTRSYPARRGFDQFYGYGRVNAANAVRALLPDSGAAIVPPEVEIEQPEWFSQVDPGAASMPLSATVFARGQPYTCTVEVAPGSYPNNANASDSAPGDFHTVPSSWCDGTTPRATRFAGVVASVDVAKLRSYFPPDAGDFRGPLPPAQRQLGGGRPNSEPFGFTVRVVAQTASASGQDRRNLYLHRDRDLAPGFPRRIGSDGDSSPLLVDLNGDNRNELVYATSDGVVHALQANGRELRGWPVQTRRPAFVHLGSRAFRGGEVSSRVGGAILSSLAAGDLRHDGEIDVVAADFEGDVDAWAPDGRRILHVHTNPAFSGRPLTPQHSVRSMTDRTQPGFLTAPVLADLDGDGRLEIVAAAMDRHVYAWHANGRPVAGFPVEVVDPSKVASIDAKTGVPQFKPGVGADLNQGAIVDTPAVGDIDGDGKPEIVVGTNEEYRAGQDGGLNTGNLSALTIPPLAGLGVLSPSNGRVYALRANGSLVPGWPVKVARIMSELLPVVGEGVDGSPVIGPVTCPSGGAGMKVGVTPDAGLGYVLNPNGSSCFGNDPTNGKPLTLQSTVGASVFSHDVPYFPAVGQPAFGDLGGKIALVAPATGAMRALDLAASEYQGGQDYVGAWDAASGQPMRGFPAPVDDLQFLGGPAVADIDGQPGQEVLGGTAYLDEYAFSGSDGSVVPGWPKLTSDWTVVAPTIGTFGDPAHKVVVSSTRAGSLFAWTTPAPACSPSSWPRFHHDIANSGDYARDATPPGAPGGLTVRGGTVTFTAPGGDGPCGRAARYECFTSQRRLAAVVSQHARQLSGLPAPVDAGAAQSFALPAHHQRYVGVRAVDAAGNIGPLAVARIG